MMQTLDEVLRLEHTFVLHLPEREIRGLTIKRPYAERIATGAKLYEIRNFRTDYRGPVLVTVSGEQIAYCVVRLVGIVPVADIAQHLAPDEIAYGKWAWILDNPQMIEPFRCPGKLGLWRYTATLEYAV